MKHTPTPWKTEPFNGCISIYGGNRFVCDVDLANLKHISEEDAANAAFIVKACNHHDELEELLEELEGYLEHNWLQSSIEQKVWDLLKKLKEREG